MNTITQIKMKKEKEKKKRKGNDNIILYHIILYIIKVGLRRRGCAKWQHQIVEIFLNF